MTVQVHVENTFSIPIYTSNVDVSEIQKIDFDDLNFLDDYRITKNWETYIAASENEQLLSTDKRFFELRKQIDKHVFHYFEEVLGYDSTNVYPELVASWMIKSSPGNVTAWHSHGNSIFSGVVYIKTSDNCGDIAFRLNDNQVLPPVFSLPVKKQTCYNDPFHKFKVEDGLIILFPSWLSHRVLRNETKDPRYSIAFNYFIKGNFQNRTGQLVLR